MPNDAAVRRSSGLGHGARRPLLLGRALLLGLLGRALLLRGSLRGSLRAPLQVHSALAFKAPAVV